jgi:hypothetical protein
MFYNIFGVFLKKESHYGELLLKLNFTLYSDCFPFIIDKYSIAPFLFLPLK